MLGTLQDEDRTWEEVEAELLAMLDGPAGLGTNDWARAAALAVDLTLRVHGREELGPDVTEGLRALENASLRDALPWNLALSHVRSGRLAEAEALLRFGLEAAGPAYAAQMWQLRAEAARLGGRWEEAQRHLDEVERCLPAEPPAEPRARARDFAQRAHLARDRGQILLELGLLDRCNELVRRALEAAEASGDAAALATARLLAIDRQLMSGEPEAALRLTGAALLDARLAPWHARFRLAAGLAGVERVRTAGALPELVDATREALEAAAQGPLPRTEGLRLALARCELELLLGRGAEARAHLAHARSLVQPASSSALLPREAVLVADLAWRLAEAAPETDEARSGARVELFAAWDQLLAQWAATPLRPGGIGFLHLAWRARVLGDVLAAELAASPGTDGIERAFARLLEAEASGTAARERGQRHLTLAQVRADLLAERRGLLVLFPAPDCGHLFVLDGSGPLEHHEIQARRDQLRAQAVEVTTALRPGSVFPGDALAQLDEALLPAGSRRRMAAWSEAFTVGFDLQRDLPFGLLGGSPGPYAARMALAVLPSVAAGVALAEARAPLPAGGKDLLLVVAGDPPAELELTPFEFDRRQRERWLAPFAEGRCDVLEGSAATPAAVLGWPGLAETRVLHLLAHGLALRGEESSAALVLNPGPDSTRTLGSEDARRLGFRGLVILSACGAGSGPPRTGDDRLVSLAGAFLEAGARAVIFSRFPVDYRATLALMEELHRSLAEGASPAEALRAASAARLAREGAGALRAATFEVLGLGFDPVLAR